MQYIWLIILWLAFGTLHSVLAASGIKNWVQRLMRHGYKYYRAIYSLIAVASLTVVLWYHFTLPPQLLWPNTSIEKAAALVIGLTGLAIMGISIKKYFMQLSGISVFLKPSAANPPILQQNGLHKYMRHPLYFGTLLFVWSLFIWQPSISNVISAACITIYTIAGIYFEEKKLAQLFGEAYRLYTQKVPMLIPRLR